MPVTQVVTVTIVLAIFAIVFATYDFVFLAQVLPHQRKSWLVPILASAVHILGVLALWSYLMALLKDPGEIPEKFVEWASDPANTDVVRDLTRKNEFQDGVVTRCIRCKKYRPERAHHCKMLNRCVLRMDHYCPWTANTVGFNNHKYFLLLGFYGCVGLIVVFFSQLPELVYCISGWSYGTNTDDGVDWKYHVSTTEGKYFLAGGVLAFLVSLLLVWLLVGHLPNLLVNLTSIEEIYDGPNPYRLGDSAANVSEVFGAFGVDWFLPVAPWHPVGDGVSFARLDETLPKDLCPREAEIDFTDSDDEQLVEDLWRYRYSQALLDVPEAQLPNR